ncbi:Sin-like protein conserved region-domain-containing protein [Gaertneriomyces semiglobifer]|nr:Sin-like protein conserved region-domain-containing protein [Gaertneriomyces semiglobifer]
MSHRLTEVFGGGYEDESFDAEGDHMEYEEGGDMDGEYDEEEDYGAEAVPEQGDFVEDADGQGAMVTDQGREVYQEDEDEGAEDDEVDDDPDDPIITQYDVYFTPTEQDIFLFQYPTRPQPFDEDSRPAEARMKPKAKRFELDIHLDTRGEHYNKERGEELGHGTDNAPIRGVFDYDDDRPAKLLDKQTLTSSLLPLNATYMAGAFRNGDLHLIRIGAAVQLRPSLGYIDKINEKQAKRYEEDSMEENKRNNPDAEDDTKVLAITMKGNEDKEAVRRAMQAELKMQAELEEWQTLPLFHPGSNQSWSVIEKIHSALSTKAEVLSTATTYLDAINPSLAAIKVGKEGSSVVRRGTPLHELKLLPLADKLKALLINAYIASHASIMKFLGDGHTEEEIIEELVKIAVIVRSAWIVRSELLYTGRALEARKWLLYMFQTSEIVSRRLFVEAARIPAQMATNMLSEIAIFIPMQGWGLKVRPDDDFMACHARLVTDQERLLAKEAEAARLLLNQAPPARAEPPQPVPGRQAQPGRNAVPRNTSAAGASASASTRAAASASKNPYQGIAVTGSTAKAQLEDFISRVLADQNVCSMDYLVEACLARAKDSSVRNNLLLNSPLTPEYISKVVESMCANVKGLWVRAQLGNVEIDKYRPVAIQLFTHQETVLKKDFMQLAKQMFPNDPQPPVMTWQRIIKELAVGKGQVWVCLS